MVFGTVGTAWPREKEGKKFFSARLDFGILGRLDAVIFENKPQEDGKKRPTHSLSYVPKEGGKRIYFGGFWKNTSTVDGTEYFRGTIELHRLARLKLAGTSLRILSATTVKVIVYPVQEESENGKASRYDIFVARERKTKDSNEAKPEEE